MRTRTLKTAVICVASLVLSACASQRNLLQSPAVDLTSVQVSEISFSQQTFLLGLSVSNPNPVPLPVRSVQYQVRINDQNFAGGEAVSEFTVPARGNEDIVISVNLDLLRSSAQLSSLIRSGVRDNLDYELNGNIGIDLPMAPTLDFSNSGTIIVQADW